MHTLAAIKDKLDLELDGNSHLDALLKNGILIDNGPSVYVTNDIILFHNWIMQKLYPYLKEVAYKQDLDNVSFMSLIEDLTQGVALPEKTMALAIILENQSQVDYKQIRSILDKHFVAQTGMH